MAFTWTASSWHKASKEGHFWRSSAFNKIEKAIGKYKNRGTPDEQLLALKAILDAISEWRVEKQEAKGGPNFKSPLSNFSSGDKLAAKEKDLNFVEPGKSLSIRSKVTDELLFDVVKEIDAVLDVKRSGWGNTYFTDPDWHDETDFRYLVSAQSESKKVVEYRERTIKNPKLLEDAVISASVISNEEVHVWGPTGFILSAPKSCIGTAMKGDLGTRNAVASGHALEKYREILRLYFSGGVGNDSKLPAPTSLRRPMGHNEVAVLGRSYGQTTTVSGIYVIVDKVSPDGSDITPVMAGGVCCKFIEKGTTNIKTVIRELPGVTDYRMEQWRHLETSLGIPIVQISATNAVEINGKYFPNIYDYEVVLCPLPKNVVVHGSPEHLNLKKEWSKYSVTFFSGHDKCDICSPTAGTHKDFGK